MHPHRSRHGCLPHRALLVAPWCLLMAACSESPSRNILGSYFPTWMVCALLGIVGVLAIRWAFVKSGIDAALPVPVLVYLSLWIAVTLAIWLIWLG